MVGSWMTSVSTSRCASGHHSVFHEDKWWIVYCFADAEHAEKFRIRFGGERFDPKDRGRRSSWTRGTRPDAEPILPTCADVSLAIISGSKFTQARSRR